jgi:pimeloyl-ACP methyl ester carboxylesterase
MPSPRRPYHVVLLPGLDGTGWLFREFAELAPDYFSPNVISLPHDDAVGYDELARAVGADLFRTERLVVVAESFSGPLALRLSRTLRPLAVVLCASFVRSPLGQWLTNMPLAAVLGLPLPRPAVAWALTDGDAALAGALQRALASVPPRVRSERVRAIQRLDATDDLANCPCPVLYLRGARDRVVRERSAREVREIRPDAVIATVDAPHLLLQTRPREAWQLIDRFLGRGAAG